MTREELAEQLEQLRDVVERLAADIPAHDIKTEIRILRGDRDRGEWDAQDDDRTVHDMSREELLGQIMRMREELDRLV